MQLDELIPNITLLFHQNDTLFAKIETWGAKTSVFGRLIEPIKFISAKSRYAQR
jgi:hypothetical protein